MIPPEKHYQPGLLCPRISSVSGKSHPLSLLDEFPAWEPPAAARGTRLRGFAGFDVLLLCWLNLCSCVSERTNPVALSTPSAGFDPSRTPRVQVRGATPAACPPHLLTCPAQARGNQRAGDRCEGKCEETSFSCCETPLVIERWS